MSTTLIFVLFAVVSYMLGAIPFGLIAARMKGVDIRKTGSGNIGATNVFRSVGKTLGIITFVLDMLKGFGPAWFLPRAATLMFATPEAQALPLGLVCGRAAIAGHNWPVYLGFKGGKGIATSAGVLLGIAPLAVGAGVIVWIVVFLLTRYVSVGSILAAVAVALSSWWFYSKDEMLRPVALTILAALAVFRHKENIRRLLHGTENRFEFGKKKEQAAATLDDRD
jgi:acyl phosphate:glycerol-3-phosphate acyltransferase